MRPLYHICAAIRVFRPALHGYCKVRSGGCRRAEIREINKNLFYKFLFFYFPVSRGVLRLALAREWRWRSDSQVALLLNHGLGNSHTRRCTSSCPFARRGVRESHHETIPVRHRPIDARRCRLGLIVQHPSFACHGRCKVPNCQCRSDACVALGGTSGIGRAALRACGEIPAPQPATHASPLHRRSPDFATAMPCPLRTPVQRPADERPASVGTMVAHPLTARPWCLGRPHPILK